MYDTTNGAWVMEHLMAKAYRLGEDHGHLGSPPLSGKELRQALRVIRFRRTDSDALKAAYRAGRAHGEDKKAS